MTPLGLFGLVLFHGTPAGPEPSKPMADLAWSVMGGMANKERILVFCGMRKTCEKLAEDCVKLLQHGDFAPYVRVHDLETMERRASLIDLVNASREGMTNHESSEAEQLQHWLKMGVAFHHAGLSEKHRTLIEKAFADGIVRVLFATTEKA